MSTLVDRQKMRYNTAIQFITEEPMKKKLSSLLALVLVLAGAYFGFFDGGDTAALLPADQGVVYEEISEILKELPQQEPTQDVLDILAQQPAPEGTSIDPTGSYTHKDDVALYIHTYNCLPPNFMTKDEARALGWEGGGLDRYADGMCIGGDRFGNYEGILPEAPGRFWTECDIDTLHADSRGAKRIVFSNDGLIYYTSDHYESFELLYGEP